MYPPHVTTLKTSGLAIASMVLGLSTLCSFGTTGPPAVVCGLLGLHDIRTRQVPGDGMAVAGIVFGTLACLGWLGWWATALIGRAL